ncbi:MAG TPA: glycosyltransferase family 2 protein [Terriglobia bacterium]|nr:glycosyltransferase family 2 protein [Terriglobia bacterium]
MWNNKTVSIVLPAYNEEAGIREAVETFFATNLADEVIVVDNNSVDRTVEEALKAKATVIHETTQGYGAALTRGLKEASGEYVILAEPDGTFESKDILKLLSYSEDFEMVCGTRTTPELIWVEANMTWFLRFGNIVVAKWMQALHNTCSLSDCGCTMRLVRREALHRFLPYFTVRGSHFLPEMLILARKAGLSMVEVPINYRGRKGTSKITGTFKGTWKTGINMIKLITWYRFNTPAPLMAYSRPRPRSTDPHSEQI